MLNSKGVCLSKDSHPSLSTFKKFPFVDFKKVSYLFTKEVAFGIEYGDHEVGERK